jgi:hypothetical protein
VPDPQGPLARLGRYWNWKCAALSMGVRGALFFTTNLPAGTRAALLALATDMAFRGALAGCFGALIQALSAWRRRRLATMVTLAAVPAASHAVEALVHWRAGTPLLAVSMAASVSLTLLTTTFDLFAMRRRAFLTGPDGDSLWSDLRRLIPLLIAFASVPFAWLGRHLPRRIPG